MAIITHRDQELMTAGQLPAIGSTAPDFRLTSTDLNDVSLGDFRGKRIVLNIFPSIDTPTCAASVRRFNQLAASISNTTVLCVSKDLPFAHKRFCAAEGIENVKCLSQYKDQSFSLAYGVDIMAGSVLAGLMSRAIVVVNEQGNVIHNEQVSDIGSEPDYERVLSVLQTH